MVGNVKRGAIEELIRALIVIMIVKTRQIVELGKVYMLKRARFVGSIY